MKRAHQITEASGDADAERRLPMKRIVMRKNIRVDRMLLPAGIFLLLIGALWSARQIGYSRWPLVNAEVLSARIVEEQSRDRPGGPAYSTFRPEVRYRYTTPEGRDQEATTFAGRWSKSIGEADRFIAEHPVGSRTMIRLDPEHPGQVRFDVGMRLSTLWQPFLALAGAAACGLVLWRRRRGLAPA